MKNKLLILFALMFLCAFAYAQERTVTGKVTSGEDNSSLPGVSVVVKGTTTGTITNIDGDYTLSLPAGADTLVFSFIGFESQEVVVGSQSIIAVTLQPEATDLQEVIVTALGVERESRALGYAVASLDSDQVAQKAEADPIRSLTGKIAGLNIISSSGAAGGSTNITIRGKSSLGNNNQPLFVVDGIPFDNSSFQTQDFAQGAGPYTNRAFDIDPNNIEKVTVLKGAAASALYGSRAANGVILITTKSNRKLTKKGLELALNIGFSFEEVANLVDVQREYSQGAGFSYNGGFVGTWGARYEDIGPVPHPLDQPRFNTAFPEFIGQTITVAPRNNAEEFFRTGELFETGLNISTGNDKASLTAGFNRTANSGIVPNNNIERINFSFGGNVHLDNGLYASGSINYVKIRQEGPQLGTPVGFGTSVVTRLLFTPPNYDLANYPFINPEDGSNVYYRTDQDNPYWLVETSPYLSSVDRYFGNLSLGYDITEWLSVSYRFGLNAYTDRRQTIVARGSNVIPNGQIIEDNIYRQELDGTLLINFDKNLSDDFNLRIVLGNNVKPKDNRETICFGNGFYCTRY